MKRISRAILCIVLGAVMMLSVIACGGDRGGKNPRPENFTRPQNVNIDTEFTDTGNTLIAYLSKTNTTERVAKK